MVSALGHFLVLEAAGCCCRPSSSFLLLSLLPSLYSVLWVHITIWKNPARVFHRSDGYMPFLILRVGADGGGGTPVPIPNTAVKPTCAENTWLEAAWENKQMPT